MQHLPTLSAEYLGSFALKFNQETFDYSANHGRGGVLPRFCRELIRRGHHPEETIRVTRNGKQSFARHDTLAFWAGISVEESGSRSIRIVKYRPMPVTVAAALPKRPLGGLALPAMA